MTIIVRDDGFHADDWQAGFGTLESLGANRVMRGLEVPSDTSPELLANKLAGIVLIRIDFPDFSDGRGFTIARQLRLMGYHHRLRANGHIIADQYAMARRAGFDEVEISDDLAARQPHHQWLARADWQAHDYQSRLRTAV